MSPTDIPGVVRAELARQSKQHIALQRVLGISKGTLHRRLTGQSPFNANELMAVADFLGMSVSELVGESKASA